MFEPDYTNDYVRAVITSELGAFPGVTTTMLNLRLKIRLLQSNTKVIKQMIEDGEIVVRYKEVHNVAKPVRVLYLAGHDPRVDDSMINSADEQKFDGNIIGTELDTRY